MPPSCARAIASRGSVTVSMAADTSGDFQIDFPRQAAVQTDVPGQYGGMRRQQEDIIEGKGFLHDAHKGGEGPAVEDGH